MWWWNWPGFLLFQSTQKLDSIPENKFLWFWLYANVKNSIVLLYIMQTICVWRNITSFERFLWMFEWELHALGLCKVGIWNGFSDNYPHLPYLDTPPIQEIVATRNGSSGNCPLLLYLDTPPTLEIATINFLSGL